MSAVELPLSLDDTGSFTVKAVQAIDETFLVAGLGPTAESWLSRTMPWPFSWPGFAHSFIVCSISSSTALGACVTHPFREQYCLPSWQFFYFDGNVAEEHTKRVSLSSLTCDAHAYLNWCCHSDNSSLYSFCDGFYCVKYSGRNN